MNSAASTTSDMCPSIPNATAASIKWKSSPSRDTRSNHGPDTSQYPTEASMPVPSGDALPAGHLLRPEWHPCDTKNLKSLPMPHPNWLNILNQEVISCNLCPRLVLYREQIARDK